jgi:hypothetical protein
MVKVALLIFSIFFAFCSASFQSTIKVEPAVEDCFYEDVKRGVTVDFEYHVIEGGLLDIDIKV